MCTRLRGYVGMCVSACLLMSLWSTCVNMRLCVSVCNSVFVLSRIQVCRYARVRVRVRVRVHVRVRACGR